MAIAQVTVVPLGTKSTSLSAYVAAVARWLEDEGIPYRLTPMGTVLEGDPSWILETVRRMHEQPFSAGADRVMTLVNLDDRRDKPATAEAKVRSVREKLEKKP